MKDFSFVVALTDSCDILGYDPSVSCVYQSEFRSGNRYIHDLIKYIKNSLATNIDIFNGKLGDLGLNIGRKTYFRVCNYLKYVEYSFMLCRNIICDLR